MDIAYMVLYIIYMIVMEMFYVSDVGRSKSASVSKPGSHQPIKYQILDQNRIRYLQ